MRIKNICGKDMAFGNTLLKAGETKDIDLSKDKINGLVKVKKIEVVSAVAVKEPTEKPKINKEETDNGNTMVRTTRSS